MRTKMQVASLKDNDMVANNRIEAALVFGADSVRAVTSASTGLSV
jgi:hypothetical protein